MTLPDFLEMVVEATADCAACYKPNAAFFERLGPEGMAGLARILQSIRARGIPVIVDAKRGDVDSTAQAYADAYFGGPFDADAMTVNPSVGLDAIEPFRAAARERDRGVFLLLRTSNPGAALFQEPAEAGLVAAIREEPAFGAVVGATVDPATVARLRAALPGTLFLAPGFGAQGGTTLAPFFRGGRGALVSSSRAVIYAGDREAIRRAARAAHEKIEGARKGRG
jgi:orotidine-5'-phosphate decarboxylase